MWTQNSKKRVKKQLWDVNSELQEKNKKRIVRCELRIPKSKKTIVRCELRIPRKE